MHPAGIFTDRRHAGQELAAALGSFRDSRALVVALPRGGVEVAAGVAEELRLELEILVVRKIGAPGNEEYAIGAIGPGGILVTNERAGKTDADLAAHMAPVIGRERAELLRREALYRKNLPPLAVAGRAILLVDNGIATGATMRAALRVLRHLGCGPCTVAVPVAYPDAAASVRAEADALVALLTPEDFRSVGRFYQDFSPTSDATVIDLLTAASSRQFP